MEIINEDSVYKRDLPNATIILVLGIIAFSLSFNYEILAFVLAIVTLVMSSHSRRLFKYNPQHYIYSSYKRIVVGRICAIIALVISIFAILLAILVVLGIVGGISLMALTDMFI